MPEKPVLRLVHYLLDAVNGQPKFFCQRLVADAVKQATLENSPVSFIENPFIDCR